MFTEQAMQNALFVRRMEREHEMYIDLPVHPVDVRTILLMENESKSIEEQEALLKMLAIGKGVLILSEIVEGETPHPDALCSIEEDGVWYSFLPSNHVAPMCSYDSLLTGQDFALPTNLFRVYKKTKSGDVCYRDHEIAHTPLNQPIYPYSFSN